MDMNGAAPAKSTLEMAGRMMFLFVGPMPSALIRDAIASSPTHAD